MIRKVNIGYPIDVDNSIFPGITTLEELLKLISIPGTTDTCAAWNGYMFETLRVNAGVDDVIWVEPLHSEVHERTVEMHFPIDPRITISDVEHATHAYANDDNTGWLFKHQGAGVHQDHLLDLRDKITSLFQAPIDKLDIKQRTATNAPLAATLMDKLVALHDYRADVISAAIAAEKRQPHGHYIRNRNNNLGHVHGAIQRALSTTKAAWASTPEGVVKYRMVSAQAVEIGAMMNVPFHPSTRWEIAERLAAKKKAEATAAADPTDTTPTPESGE